MGAALTSLSALADIKSDLLAKSDQDLWRAGRSGGVGKCYIARSIGSAAVCDFYLKTSKWGASQTYNGLPTKGGVPYGSGCLSASSASVMNPALPSDIKEAQSKNVTTCWGPPNTYQSFNSSPTPICTPDHVKNAANMLRIAIKDTADPCDFASLPPASNQAADTASELLVAGNIKFADLNAGGLLTDCWRVNAGAPIQGIKPAVKLPAKTCRRLRNRFMALKGPSAFLPTMDVAQWQAMALGKLTAVQILDIFRNLYLDMNQSVLYQLDQKNQVDISTLTAAQLTTHEAEIAALAAQIKEPTEAEKLAKLMQVLETLK